MREEAQQAEDGHSERAEPPVPAGTSNLPAPPSNPPSTASSMTRLVIGHQPWVKDKLAVEVLPSQYGETVPADPEVALPAL